MESDLVPDNLPGSVPMQNEPGVARNALEPSSGDWKHVVLPFDVEREPRDLALPTPLDRFPLPELVRVVQIVREGPA